MFAILSGLGHGSVSRLKQTWERLSSKYQRMYQEMQDLMDPSRNMSKYRNLVQNENIQSPIVSTTPSFPLITQSKNTVPPSHVNVKIFSVFYHLIIIIFVIVIPFHSFADSVPPGCGARPHLRPRGQWRQGWGSDQLWEAANDFQIHQRPSEHVLGSLCESEVVEAHRFNHLFPPPTRVCEEEEWEMMGEENVRTGIDGGSFAVARP